MGTAFTHGYALLIGVGQTEYARWSLPVTVKDAQAIAALLVDPELCGYPGDDQHLRLLANQQATREAIIGGLAWLALQAQADPDATIMVYYSGHGWVDEQGRYYLIQHDSDPLDLAGTALAAEQFSQALRAIPARRLLALLDCCHAEGMASAKQAGEARLPAGYKQAAPSERLTELLKQGEGRAVFTSSRGEQRSWVRPDQSMSIYTYHLLEALQGAGSRPGDTVVSLSQLMGHLKRTVPRSARQLAQAEQEPFFNLASEDFPIALIRGGKGLSAAGWQGEEQAQAEQTIRRLVQVTGSRNVTIGGDVSGSVVITGDNNNVV